MISSQPRSTRSSVATNIYQRKLQAFRTRFVSRLPPDCPPKLNSSFPKMCWTAYSQYDCGHTHVYKAKCVDVLAGAECKKLVAEHLPQKGPSSFGCRRCFGFSSPWEDAPLQSPQKAHLAPRKETKVRINYQVYGRGDAAIKGLPAWYRALKLGRSLTHCL